jgi:uncharacterized membrane protein
MTKPDTLYVLAAAYDNVDDAVTDYEAVNALYRDVGTSHEFDSAVFRKDEKGKVRIVAKHEQPTRHGAKVGLGWGVAAGVASILFPPLGIGLVAGGAGGAAIGAIIGHASGGMKRSDIKDLGDTLDGGQAGLIVVYETNLADQVAANIKFANKVVSRETDMEADRLAAEMKSAEQTLPVPEQPRAAEDRKPAEG